MILFWMMVLATVADHRKAQDLRALATHSTSAIKSHVNGCCTLSRLPGDDQQVVSLLACRSLMSDHLSSSRQGTCVSSNHSTQLLSVMKRTHTATSSEAVPFVDLKRQLMLRHHDRQQPQQLPGCHTWDEPRIKSLQMTSLCLKTWQTGS